MPIKHILSINDLTKKECKELVKGRWKKSSGNAVLLFELPSTRTKTSFELGLKEMGMKTSYLNTQTTQITRGETIEDTARVLSSYANVIIARMKEHDTLTRFSRASESPVINALSNLEHPTQAINDFYTIDKTVDLRSAKIVWVGDGTNVCNSIILLAKKLNVKLKVATPKKYKPAYECNWTEDPKEAVEEANVIMTDAWVSMGQHKHAKQKIKALKRYQINSKLVKNACQDWFFMHCLPAHREQEVTKEIIDGKRSLVWKQAKNKKLTAKAVVSLALKKTKGL